MTAFFPFLILIAVFYFLLIRPQQKKMKTHKDMLSKVDKGDTILTTGGMFGRVTNVRDDAFILEIADNVRVKISKSAIHSRQPDGAEQDK
ncbi:MAG: preprotein translocase subunit YajC [Deltaproteobacteria bacterium]|nr:preprotein translocase subunit YajC [Deltaproteobacteria bacterium]